MKRSLTLAIAGLGLSACSEKPVETVEINLEGSEEVSMRSILIQKGIQRVLAGEIWERVSDEGILETLSLDGMMIQYVREKTLQPDGENTKGWSAEIFVDANTDGKLDGGKKVRQYPYFTDEFIIDASFGDRDYEAALIDLGDS